MPIKLSLRYTLLVLVVVYAFSPLRTFAAGPDAGEILRQQQQLQPPQNIPLNVEEQDQGEGQYPTDAPALHVTAFRFVGDLKGLNLDALQKIVAPYQGRELTLDDLKRVAGRVTKYLHRRGFTFARTFIAPQEVKEGTVDITIVLGRLEGGREGDGIEIQGQGLRIKEQMIHRHLAKATATGDSYLNMSSLERGLLLLNDLPALRARGELQAGSAPGTSKLVARIAEDPVLSAHVSTDDFGNRYTGNQRYNLQMDVNDPFGNADQITAATTLSERLSIFRGGYNFPVGDDGLRLGANYTDLHYRIGEEFKDLDARGTANIGSLNASYPFVRSRRKNIFGLLDYDYKALRDESQSVVVNNKRINVWTVGVSGNVADEICGGGLIYYSASTTAGELNLSRSASGLINDAAGPNTEGAYVKFNYNAARLQRLTKDWSLFASINGQAPGKNLDSSEKFILGGPTGVRAYPVGEGTGDGGWLSNVELRYDIPVESRVGRWQLVSFYDTGSVTRYKDTWAGWDAGATGQPNRYRLSGAGAGINLSKSDTYAVRLSYAWALGSNPGRSAGGLNADGTDHRGQLWVQAILNF